MRSLHPCSGPVGEDERAGRWWWETDEAKECGLHFTPEGKVERTRSMYSCVKYWNVLPSDSCASQNAGQVYSTKHYGA